MRDAYAEAKIDIEIKLFLNKCLGYLDELTVDTWLEAINSLEADEFAELVRMAKGQTKHQLASLTLQFLSQRNYAFREFIMYNTTQDFQYKMGLSKSINP